MSLGLNILLILIFLLLGSVFAGTELALVSLRGSQIDQMELQDARGARVAKIARDPNTFLSSVQIGVTLSGFLSASFGESSIAPFVVPVVEGWGVPHHVAAPLTTIGLTLIISYCSIVISELVPKRIAMQRNEAIARAVVPAIDVFSKVCRPLIWLIGKNTNGLVRLLGFDPNETETEVSDDELRVLVNSNTNLSKDERTILDDVFDASETIVAEVMRPRADVVFIDGSMSLDEAAAFVRDQPYSRYPVTGKDFDDVLGFVHVRDLLDVRDPEARVVADVVREGILLPGMFVQVHLVGVKTTNALLVPQRAVQQLLDESFVLVVGADGKSVSKNVKLGEKVGSYYIIEKGLDPTDVVIVEGLTTLRAGQDIDVTMVTPEEMGFSTTESTEITDKS